MRKTVFGLDENVGRVLDCVDQAGLRDNTIVIYMGDNGFELGEHGFYDKRDAFEHSIRVPMLVRAPGQIRRRDGRRGDGPKHRYRRDDLGRVPGKTIRADPVWTGDRCACFGDETPESKQTLATTPWRDHLLYEISLGMEFPGNPNHVGHSNRTFSSIFIIMESGTTNGFLRLQTDPHERHNLIDVPVLSATDRRTPKPTVLTKLDGFWRIDAADTPTRRRTAWATKTWSGKP